MVSKMYNCKRAWFGCCSWGSCRGRRSDICFRLVKKMVMITSEIYEIIFKDCRATFVLYLYLSLLGSYCHYKFQYMTV